MPTKAEDVEKGSPYMVWRKLHKKLCADWKSSPTLFFAWCVGHGWERGSKLVLIDNHTIYGPGTCKVVRK